MVRCSESLAHLSWCSFLQLGMFSTWDPKWCGQRLNPYGVSKSDFTTFSHSSCFWYHFFHCAFKNPTDSWFVIYPSIIMMNIHYTHLYSFVCLQLSHFGPPSWHCLPCSRVSTRLQSVWPLSSTAGNPSVPIGQPTLLLLLLLWCAAPLLTLDKSTWW